MNPEIKAQWVAALRSGEYSQGKGWLRDGDNFCCLGVLCDIHAKENGEFWDAKTQKSQIKYLGCDTHPPKRVDEWAETYGTPEVIIGGKNLFVTDHNDGGRTFAEIADAIEAQL